MLTADSYAPHIPSTTNHPFSAMQAEDLKYAKTHEWVAISEEGDKKIATMGLSQFALDALTDLVFMELPEVGAQIKPGEPCCEIESVKAVSDIYSPVEGQVVEVNKGLPDRLETLGEDPYNDGWIARIEMSSDAGLADLLDHAAYEKMCQEEQH
jgi:glycine cleavage system H protein